MKKTKRVILAKGKHWFYSKSSLQGKSGSPHNLVGVLDKNNELIDFKNLIQSRTVKIILEYKV